MSGLIPLVSGLIVKPIHSAELTQTLLELRYRWPHRWPGLAHVFKACLRRLGCDVDGQVSRSSDCSKAGTSQRFQVLFNSAMAIARLSEHQSRRQNEPSYHNRLHTADTLISMTALLSQTSSIGCSDSRDHNTCSRAFDADHFAFMLLVMLCHDVSHPGKINRFRFANELHSLRIVFPLLTREGLALRDQQRLRQLIIIPIRRFVLRIIKKPSPSLFRLTTRYFSKCLSTKRISPQACCPNLRRVRAKPLLMNGTTIFPT